MDKNIDFFLYVMKNYETILTNLEEIHTNYGYIESINNSTTLLSVDFISNEKREYEIKIIAVSYTHLTLPTKRIV